MDKVPGDRGSLERVLEEKQTFEDGLADLFFVEKSKHLKMALRIFFVEKSKRLKMALQTFFLGVLEALVPGGCLLEAVPHS